MARRDLFHKSYELGAIQASRGCPFMCEFCSLSVFNGKKYRARPIENVIRKIEQIPQNFFWFVDNNLFGNSATAKNWAKSLFWEMKKRKINKTWLCFANLKSTGDDEMLGLAYEAGCRIIFIGIEAEENVYAKKIAGIRPGKLKLSDLFSRIHSHSIIIFAGIIMGLDSDTKESIQNRVDFVLQSQIDCYMVTAFTPFPGTKLYKRLSDEGRIRLTSYPGDWEKYTWKNPVFSPNNMSYDQFFTALTGAYKKLYSEKTIIAKYKQTTQAIGSADIAHMSLRTNKDLAAVFNRPD